MNANSQTAATALRLARHLVGVGIVVIWCPIVLWANNAKAGVDDWLSNWASVTVLSVFVTALYGLFFTSQFRALWPKPFIRILWTIVLFTMLGWWNPIIHGNRNSTPAKTTSSISNREKSELTHPPVIPGKVPQHLTGSYSYTWTDNYFDRYESTNFITEKAQKNYKLQSKEKWVAISAWQNFLVRGNHNTPGEALYGAIGLVLQGLESGRGLCIPHKIQPVTKTLENDQFKSGSEFAEELCKAPNGTY